jgi:hypothetical protein
MYTIQVVCWDLGPGLTNRIAFHFGFSLGSMLFTNCLNLANMDGGGSSCSPPVPLIIVIRTQGPGSGFVSVLEEHSGIQYSIMVKANTRANSTPSISACSSCH